MKINFTLLVILGLALLVTGCGKSSDTPETPEARVVRLLTGGGNRYWHISEIYVNGQKQVLTDYQLKYTKTFTASLTADASFYGGSFNDENGYAGTWKLLSTSQLYMKLTNNPSGPVAYTYIINNISETSLDMEYTANMKTEREVYYGF